MKKHNWIPRTLAALMCVSLVTDGGFFLPMQVKAAEDELPEAITLPITPLDFRADNLLFQYDLDDAGDFALTGTVFEEKYNGFKREFNRTDTYVMKGLVENKLDPATHVPIYRKETVEQVAKFVLAQMVNPCVRNTADGFPKIYEKLYRPVDNAVNAEFITDNRDNKLTQKWFYSAGTADTMGWTIHSEGYTAAGNGVRVGGTLIWIQEYGIHHGLGAPGTDTLTKTITGLDPNASYTLTAEFEQEGCTLYVPEIDDSMSRDIPAKDGGEIARGGDKATQTMAITGKDSITLRIEATGNCYINNLYLEKDGEESSRRVFFDFSYTADKFTHSGWYAADGSGLTENGAYLQDGSGTKQWEFGGDGLTNYGDNSSVCTDLALNGGANYMVTYRGGSALTIEIQGSAGVIASNVKSGDLITTPGDGKIKVVVKGTGDPAYADWSQNKLVDLSISQPTAVLGDYNESRNKFNTLNGGYNDIATCMDYAYYVLNHFWLEQDNLSWRSSDFNSITLKALNNQGDYGFFADVSGVSEHSGERVYYDLQAHNIRNDGKGEPGGLFPLDWAKSWGVDRRKDYTCGTAGHMHNFHYSLYSHATFIYEEEADLYFDFVGDDDVYLFINGQLAMDIGGAHLAAHDHIEINQLIEAGVLDELEDGLAYTFDFFYMERHTEYSNLAIQTNIQLLPDGILDLNFYDEDGNPLKKGDAIKPGSKVEMEYEFHVNVDGVTNVNFEDEGLGIVIGTGGLKYGKNISLKDGKITIIIEEVGKEPVEYTFDNEEELKRFFDEAIFNKNTVVRVRGLMYTANIEKGTLQADVRVSFNSPNYAGAVAETSNETASDFGNLIVVGASGSHNSQSSTSGQNSPADTSTSASESTMKSPATDDRAPIVLSLVSLLLGFMLVGAAAYLKKQEQRHTA